MPFLEEDRLPSTLILTVGVNAIIFGVSLTFSFLIREMLMDPQTPVLQNASAGDHPEKGPGGR